MDYDSDFFEEVVMTSTSAREAVLKLGLSLNASNYKNVKIKAIEKGYDISHWLGHKKALGKPKKYIQYSLEEILIENSTYYNMSRLKKRLVAAKLLKYECSECGIEKWNNKKLTLQIDHINGINTDNRLENLRFLCPNCHSQTETYCGKNFKNKFLTNECESCKIKIRSDRKHCKSCILQGKHLQREYNSSGELIKKLYHCIDCGKEKYSDNERCKSCAGIKRTPPKIVWPSKEELQRLVWEKSTVQLAKELGVSDKAIEKKCKKLDIEKPPRGYWAKLAAGKL